MIIFILGQLITFLFLYSFEYLKCIVYIIEGFLLYSNLKNNNDIYYWIVI